MSSGTKIKNLSPVKENFFCFSYIASKIIIVYCQTPCVRNNLFLLVESSTYEVFEKDPVKYAEYQNAMMAAITDMVPPEEKDTRVSQPKG